jgi:uncharacterized membrane protein YqjE
MSGTPEHRARPAGQALLALVHTMLDMLRTRTDLLVVELAVERRRLVQVVVYGALAVVSLALCLELLAFGTVAWFWDTAYRWPAVVLVVGSCAACTGLCALLAARCLGARPRPFEATLSALAADLDGVP